MKNEEFFQALMDRNDYIRLSWENGLRALQPKPSELEHGLQLHREVSPMDHYGFFPRVWTAEAVNYVNNLVEEGVGVRKWGEKSSVFRIIASTCNQPAGQEFRDAIRASGLKAMVVALGGHETIEGTLRSYAAHQQILGCFYQDVCNSRSVADMDRAIKEGKIACVWSITGPPALGNMDDLDDKLDWIDVWQQLGIRLMHLGYNRRNSVADGCTEANDGGVSDYGAEFIRRLNQAGIIVDVPHSGKNTVMQACSLSDKPVIASHTACRALFDHVRCKTDAELMAVANTEGLVGIIASPDILGPKADINLMLAHIKHAVQTVGADHVAIGTDLSYQTPWPPQARGYPSKVNLTVRNAACKSDYYDHYNEDHLGGSLSWTNWPLYTVGLVKIGLSDEQITMILGANFRRVLSSTQADKGFKYPKAEG